MKKQLLIIGDCNMIGAWPGLVQLKKQERLEDARELLLSRLSNYVKYEGLEITVVFDAQLIPGTQQAYKRYLLTMIFTKEDEAADSYIERLADEKNDRLARVTVTASDLVERQVIFSQDTSRTSANELYKAVQRTEKTAAIHATDIHSQQFRRDSPRNVEQLSKLSEKLEELSQKKD